MASRHVMAGRNFMGDQGRFHHFFLNMRVVLNRQMRLLALN
jgi:hypothetical protein